MYNNVKRILDSAFDCDCILNVPKDSQMGHFTTPLAFSLAKSLKKNPNQIAVELKEKLANLPQFKRVEAVNGYVNLFLSDEFLAEFSRVVLKKGDLRGESISKNFIADTNEMVDTHAKNTQCGSILDEKSGLRRHERGNRTNGSLTKRVASLPDLSPKDNAHTKHEHILLEFVSANPTGPLHIGHARGAIWGDTLARIGRFLGHKIITEYYINDFGNQVDLLLRSVYDKICFVKNIENKLNPTPESRKDFYKGDYILDLANKALQRFGDAVLDYKNEQNLAQLKAFSVEKCLDLIKANLQSANISFDNFVSEKSLMPKLDSTLERLKSNGALYEEGGKIWLKSTQYGDEKDRVIVRKDGEPTYLAGDIVYHNDKFSRDFDKYINIWGADHHGYIARIKASVAFLGYDSSKLEVLLSQMVSLLQDGAPYKMSKRAGTFILMSKIIDEIGIDALRFVFLTKRADTHLEFDITSLKAQDSSNPIFYINYANARIHTLLGKRDLGDSADLSESGDFDFANLEREWVDLLFFALLLPRILEVAFDERAMQKLPEYLKNLASKLHFCYNSFKIIGSPNEGVICNILKVVSLSITTGLGLMGITAKTKM